MVGAADLFKISLTNVDIIYAMIERVMYRTPIEKAAQQAPVKALAAISNTGLKF